jgi:NAD(P)-dependent dehydrogenase (short-subunit alcohol dehydrogenase family)
MVDTSSEVLSGESSIGHSIICSIGWLASEQNTYITGQVLGVDGGLSITF